MFDNELKELMDISQAVGNLPDLVQGGGGNTSVKLNEELMAVKASGYQLKQITPKDGFVVVNYKNIKDYYNNVDLNHDIDFEKESSEFVKQNIVQMEGLKALRPSVEAGFHSVLKKYVIHTHPVYANIVCCTKNGKELVEKIFGKKQYKYIWVPYINPGFNLTVEIKNLSDNCMQQQGKFPQVIFMENHGLVVTADDKNECIELHEEINKCIREYLDINEKYPEVKVEKVDEDTYKSATQYLNDFFKGKDIEEKYFDEVVLYPDQLVYLNGSICVNRVDNKLNINTSKGEIIYKTSYNEAVTIEETLLGFLYVVDMISKKNLPLKTMSEEEQYFIKNWESEKYRKSLLKGDK